MLLLVALPHLVGELQCNTYEYGVSLHVSTVNDPQRINKSMPCQLARLAEIGAVYTPAGKLIPVSSACSTSWQMVEVMRWLVSGEIAVVAQKRAVRSQIKQRVFALVPGHD